MGLSVVGNLDFVMKILASSKCTDCPTLTFLPIQIWQKIFLLIGLTKSLMCSARTTDKIYSQSFKIALKKKKSQKNLSREWQ